MVLVYVRVNKSHKGGDDLPSKNKAYADDMLKQAYKNYYSDVYRFCLSILMNDRESIDDCVQETFIVLYKKYLEGEKVEYVKAFLFKTVQNFVKKRLRENTKTNQYVSLEDVTELVSQNEDMDEKLSFDEYSRQISDALSQRDAELFKLRYIDDYSLEEIAQILNLSISVVGTRLHRLRKRLIIILKEILYSE